MIAPTIWATIYNQSTETFLEKTVGEILRGWVHGCSANGGCKHGF